MLLRRPFRIALAGLAALSLVPAAARRAPAGPARPGRGVSIRHRGTAAPAADRGLDAQVILTDGVRTLRRARRHLGVRPDTAGVPARSRTGAPLRFMVDRHLLRDALRRMAPYFAAPGRSARVVETRGGIRIDPGQSARWVDVPASVWRLTRLLQKDPSIRVLPLVVRKRALRLTAADREGIDGCLSRFTTRFDPRQAKRVNNMRLAVHAIDGTIVPPGRIFSLNRAVGERTQARGYRTAPVYLYGKLVPGIGGGVSQVTGTLFNAALFAGLPIVEYGTHARPVSYLPIGRDATVAWRVMDLKFRNSTRAPLYISYRISGSRATAALYGARRPGQRVRLSVKAVKLGPRHLTAVLYRVIIRDGRRGKPERIGRSDYKWKPEGEAVIADGRG